MLEDNKQKNVNTGVIKVIVKDIGFYYTFFKDFKTGIPVERHKLKNKYPDNESEFEIIESNVDLETAKDKCRQLQFKYNKEKDYIGRVRYDLSDIEGIDLKDIDIIAAYTIRIGGMVYHGSAGNFRRRRVTHLNALRNGKHDVPKMQELYDAGHMPRFIVYKTMDRDSAYDI